jgi:hypothetical protein
LENYGEKQKQAHSHAHETAPEAKGPRETPQSHAEAAKGGCTQKLSLVAPTSSGLFLFQAFIAIMQMQINATE